MRDPSHSTSPVSNPAHCAAEKKRRDELFERQFVLPKWKKLAHLAGFPTHQLTVPEVEILNLIERVLIRGRGWGPKDQLRNVREFLPISPAKLSKQPKSSSTRSYQRALRRLIDLGLLNVLGVGADQVRLCAPAWWHNNSEESSAIQNWRRAAEILQRSRSMSFPGHSDDAQLASSCRNIVTPPVPSESEANSLHYKSLPTDSVRQIPETVTRDTDSVTNDF